MVFKDYSKYYDLLYKDKEYQNEVNYIVNLIKKYSNKNSSSILDIGCGTGRHANYLSKMGYSVTGIDFSSDMIEIANKNKSSNSQFLISDAQGFRLDRKFDVIISLFHVVSYQITNQAINQMFSNVADHLEDRGIFIFDFWYGPAVLTEKPSVRIKRLEDEEISILRIAEPEMEVNSNVVHVNYDLLIKNNITLETENVKEVHNMRYLFIPEINNFLLNSKMKAVNYEEWMTGLSPSCNTWGVCCTAEKISILL